MPGSKVICGLFLLCAPAVAPARLIAAAHLDVWPASRAGPLPQTVRIVDGNCEPKRRISAPRRTPTAASVGVVVEHRITKDPRRASGCDTPVRAFTFERTDPEVWVWFLLDEVETTAVVSAEWFSPDTLRYTKDTWSRVSSRGSYCFYSDVRIAGQAAANKTGIWTVRITYNEVEILKERFAIVETSSRTGERTRIGSMLVTPSAGGRAPIVAAVFSYKTADNLVAEAGVPASRPTTRARLFADIAPPRIYTGIAIANPNQQVANVRLILLDSSGSNVGPNVLLEVPARGQTARYIDELLKDIPVPFQGILDIRSDVSVAVVTLRLSTNDRGETIFSTLPVIDPSATPSTKPAHLAHIVTGGDYTTQFVLINPTASRISGHVGYRGSDGTALLDGSSSGFSYSLAGNGVAIVETSGAGSLKVGSAMIEPGAGQAAPAAVALFRSKSGTTLISEAGVLTTSSTKHAFMFVDLTYEKYTGLAIANPSSDRSVRLTLQVRHSDGTSTPHQGTITIPASGHTARFITDFFPEIETPFQGVLEITSDTEFNPLTLRLSFNERDEAIYTTLPVADADAPSSSAAVLLPQIAAEGGYQTEVILLNPRLETSAGNLQVFGQSGLPLELRFAEVGTTVTRYNVAAGGAKWIRTRRGDDTATASIGASGGALEVPRAAFLIVPSGMTSVLTTVELESTRALETSDDFRTTASFLADGPRLAEEIRVILQKDAPREDAELEIAPPYGFLARLPAETKVLALAQWFTSNDEEALDSFQVLPHAFDWASGTIKLKLPKELFTNARRADGRYEVIVVVGSATTMPSQKNVSTPEADLLSVFAGAPACESEPIGYPLDVVKITETRSGKNGYDGKRHHGVDLVATVGEPVLSVDDGKILAIVWNVKNCEQEDPCRAGKGLKGWGKAVVVRHDNGTIAIYGHLIGEKTDRISDSPEALGMYEGKPVRKGDVIGKADTTGGADGPHLHFEYVLPLFAGETVNGALRVDPFPCIGVIPSAITVTIDPPSVIVAPLGTKQFRATVAGTTNTAVDWSATGGNISSAGLYTAPLLQGGYMVRATSVADPKKFAEATVSVTTTTPVRLLTVTRAGAGTGTVTSSPAGISCGSACSFSFPQGTPVTLTATASSGSIFGGWSGACGGTGSCTVTLDADTSVTAKFNTLTADPVLTVSKAGSGSGTVTSSPAGINCGSTCSASFDRGSQITLTATPASGSVFAGWSGACSGTGACTVSLVTDKSVTATFDALPATYTLTVIKTGSGSGNVTSSPAGISCGSTCSASFSRDARITLSAAPASGSLFVGWSGACSGTGSCTVTMDGNKSVTATFTGTVSGFAGSWRGTFRTEPLSFCPAQTGTWTATVSVTNGAYTIRWYDSYHESTQTVSATLDGANLNWFIGSGSERVDFSARLTSADAITGDMTGPTCTSASGRIKGTFDGNRVAGNPPPGLTGTQARDERKDGEPDP